MRTVPCHVERRNSSNRNCTFRSRIPATVSYSTVFITLYEEYLCKKIVTSQVPLNAFSPTTVQALVIISEQRRYYEIIYVSTYFNFNVAQSTQKPLTSYILYGKHQNKHNTTDMVIITQKSRSVFERNTIQSQASTQFYQDL